MKILSEIQQLNSHIGTKKIGIVIGNFDGVHLGHQKLLKDFVQKCTEYKTLPLLITFNPHPALYLNSKIGAFLISNFNERNELLKEIGIEFLLVLPFDANLQKLSANEFIANYLLKIAGTEFFYLGHDFRLGCGKESAKKILEQQISSQAIQVFESESFEVNGQIVSSSLIRNYIQSGDIEQVNTLLGRNYSLSEKVVNGYGVGKKELVPTANIVIHPDQLHPKSGVYFTNTIFKNKTYRSITNIGFRPSLVDDNGLSIETNIFDFDQEIYDEEIKVEFLRFHREEKKFSSKEELLTQIKTDIRLRAEFNG